MCVCVCDVLWQFLRVTLQRVGGGCCQTATVTSVTFHRSCHLGLQAEHCPMLSVHRQPTARHGRHILSALSVLTTTWQHSLTTHGLMVFIAVTSLLTFRHQYALVDHAWTNGIYCCYIFNNIAAQHLKILYLQSVSPLAVNALTTKFWCYYY